MDKNNIFKKYHNRLVLEGVIKALVVGFIVGAIGAIVFAVGALIFNSFATLDNYQSAVMTAVFAGIGIFVGLGVLAGLVAYFYRFKPTTVDIARRVDRTGLEERVVTMLQLEKDDSYIAMRQREDAKESLKKSNSKQLKLTIFAMPLFVLGVLAILFSGTLVGNSLAFANPKPWSNFLTEGENVPKPGDEVSIIYEISDGGIVLGVTNQLVAYGGDATPVMAVAEYGYAFAGWYNAFSGRLESRDPIRIDTEVKTNIYVVASFEMLVDLEPDDEEGDEEGDKKPGEPGNTPNDSSDDGDNPQKPAPDDGVGGGYRLIDTIIDGTIDYADDFEAYKTEVLRRLNEGNYPEYIRRLVDMYLSQLEPAPKPEAE